MLRIVDRLPIADEYRRVKHLVLEDTDVADDQLAVVLPSMPHLETVNLSGIRDTSDRTLVILAKANNLTTLNLSGCTHVTDIGILELTSKAVPLTTLILDGVVRRPAPLCSVRLPTYFQDWPHRPCSLIYRCFAYLVNPSRDDLLLLSQLDHVHHVCKHPPFHVFQLIVVCQSHSPRALRSHFDNLPFHTRRLDFLEVCMSSISFALAS